MDRLAAARFTPHQAHIMRPSAPVESLMPTGELNAHGEFRKSTGAGQRVDVGGIWAGRWGGSLHSSGREGWEVEGKESEEWALKGKEVVMDER